MTTANPQYSYHPTNPILAHTRRYNQITPPHAAPLRTYMIRLKPLLPSANPTGRLRIWGNSGKLRETQGNSGKLRETQGNSGKLRETQGNSGKLGETRGNSGKLGEKTRSISRTDTPGCIRQAWKTIFETRPKRHAISLLPEQSQNVYERKS